MVKSRADEEDRFIAIDREDDLRESRKLYGVKNFGHARNCMKDSSDQNHRRKASMVINRPFKQQYCDHLAVIQVLQTVGSIRIPHLGCLVSKIYLHRLPTLGTYPPYSFYGCLVLCMRQEGHKLYIITRCQLWQSLMQVHGLPKSFTPIPIHISCLR